MQGITIRVNGQSQSVNVDAMTPVLWVLREHLGLTGTKYGCGKALCGSCTIHLNGTPIRSCVTPVSACMGGEITTIEGLSENSDHPVQKAWVEAQVPQCGYCQSGQIMQAVSLLDNNANPSKEDIKSHMSGNLCRCAAYMRIIKAVEIASKTS
ncbi:MAG: (2Fe-2S)-binding protein [Flavobacteriaceae bacterium]|nr:(2Fe-2S)-binding protein [Bacteroidia bacterium]MBT8287930.1 (2Fe-2S)-binding protein [Bacteroidia bacterium]NNF74413.1 (2Fe-2S)-binding protein [Flavobacteriaceae bacterium]NNK73376.1 (2Fe-2S)-binding protein [Flavobacteriaceae bacterium]